MEQKVKAPFKFNITYALVQVAFWINFNFIFNYSTMLLRYQGVPVVRVGIIVAATYVVSILAQAFIAPFADRHQEISLNRIMSIMLLGILGICCINTFFPFAPPLISAVLFILSGALFTAILPFTNALCTRFISRGVPINYSVTRAMGSVGFALAGLAMGMLVELNGEMMIIYGRIGAVILFISVLAIFPNSAKYGMDTARHIRRHHISLHHHNKTEEAKSKNVVSEIIEAKYESLPVQKDKSTLDILKGNRPLVYFLFMIAFVFMSFGGLGTYMISIVEKLGGSPANFGMISMVNAFAEMPLMLFFKKLRKRYSLTSLLCFCMIFVIVKPVIILLATDMTLVYLSSLASFFSFSIFHPASVSFVDSLMTDGERVRGQAFITIASFGLGSTLSNVLGSFFMKDGNTDFVIWFSIFSACAGMVFMILTLVSYNKRELINAEKRLSHV